MRWIAIGALATFGGLILIAAIATSSQSSQCSAGSPAGPVGGVPAQLVPLYQGAASKYGLGPLGPAVLASINDEETAFGRNLNTSSAGAVGWMQFEPATWATYGVTPTGARAPQDPSGWNDPADGIYSAANYLHASGAPGSWQQAVLTYNHSQAYVDQVMGRAQTFYQQGVKAGKGASVNVGTVAPPTTCAVTPLSSGGLVFPFPKGAPGVTSESGWTQDQGVDISAPGGTPELAMASGTIVQEGIGGFGPNAPILKLDTPVRIAGQTMGYIYYGHAGADLMPTGTHVTAGQQISIVGYGIVGMSTGPHIEIGTMPTQAIPSLHQTSGLMLQMLKTACGSSCP